jgi:predicted ATPase
MDVAEEKNAKAEKPESGPTGLAPYSGEVRIQRLGRYELRQELGRGTTGVVYEARDTNTDAIVALKTLVSMDAESLFRLKHEFRSLANIEHENLVRFGELACEGGQWLFTMERVFGTDFLDYARDESDGWRRLRAGLPQLVEGLAALHATGRIHRDVKPSNVLVTPDGRVVLLDFGLTTGFGLDERIAGTPGFMAPEQITCETLTPATDWYAVGGILFAALTGHLPFEGDTHEILDAKLTQDAPRDWGSDAPAELRALCQELLERDPSERPDLDEIRARLGVVAPAKAPARHVFVGREKELERLRHVLVEAQSGGSRAVVVRGEPGMGKSILVEHFLSAVPSRTLVLRGRCYEQESVPFGGVDSLVDALSEYLVGLRSDDVHPLLAGGTSSVARVFPVLYRVPAIAKERVGGPLLNAAMLREQAFGELARLVSALARSRTLIIYIDDLHWADSDSLALIRAAFLSSDSQAARRLLVVTLRSGSALSPDMAEFASALETIEVPRFSSDESRALWHALGKNDDEAARDAAMQEAAGHPLFLTELLRSANGHARTKGGARLEDVLWDRVLERDDIERRFLEMTALAGAPTAYAVVAQAAGLDVGECFTRLSALRAAQLVRLSRVEDDRSVEPYHDRLREAVMQRLRERGAETIEEMHLALGRRLLAATDESTVSSRVFAIVHHLNLGRGRIESRQDKIELAELNLLASREANRATAFERTQEYAAIGAERLPAPESAAELAIWRDLRIAQFTGEYLTSGRQLARATFEATAARMPTALDKAAVYCSWIDLESATSPPDAVAAGSEILRALGMPLPRRPTKLHVLSEYVLAIWARRGRPPAAFETAPKLRDEQIQSVFRIFVVLMAAGQFSSENLLPWILLRIARISMSKGMTAESAVGLVGFGIVLTGVFGRHSEGAEFGRAGLAVARTDDDPRVAGKVAFLYPVLIGHWVAPFAEARRGLEEAERVAARCGDIPFQTHAAMQHWETGLSMGTDLTVTVAETERLSNLARRLGMTFTEHAETFAEYVAALRGKTLAKLDLPKRPPSLGFSLHRHHFWRAELGYLAGLDVAGIERDLVEVVRRKHAEFSCCIAVDVCLLRALVAARAWESASFFGRMRRVIQVAGAARQLDACARSCPANFEPYALIVRAELARIRGRGQQASRAYERAIASARTHGTPKREAMACELAMAHARTLGDRTESERYRLQAIEAYRRWGATAKANDLEA